jgi:hypothetical protein
MSSISALSLRIPVRCPALISFDLSLATIISIARKRKKLSPAHRRQQEQSLRDYAQQDLSTVIQGPPIEMQWL